MTVQEMQKHNFGLNLGQMVKIRAADSSTRTAPPWDGKTYIVKILKEHPFLFSGIVYPHSCNNKHDLSDPYSVSICKVDIIIGDVEVT